jgi:hypothetical protein
MITPESCAVEVTVSSAGSDVMEAESEWYLVEASSGGRP